MIPSGRSCDWRSWLLGGNRIPIVAKGNAETPVRGVHFEKVRGVVETERAFDAEFAPDLSMRDIEIGLPDTK